MADLNDIVKEINSADHILIYGAAMIATEALKIFSNFYPNKVVGCAVTSMKENPSKIANYPVKTIVEYEGILDKNHTVIILAMRRFINEIVKKDLLQLGYHKVYEYHGEIHNYMISLMFKTKLREFQQYEKVISNDKIVE